MTQPTMPTAIVQGEGKSTALTHAMEICNAAFRAAMPEEFLPKAVRIDATSLTIQGERFELDKIGAIYAVVFGKAGHTMAAQFERMIEGTPFWDRFQGGWGNVPEGCAGHYDGRIKLHAARPDGVNEVRPEGIEGTEQIIQIVQRAQPNDLVLVFISGGGSALLEKPAGDLDWEDVREVTTYLQITLGQPIQTVNAIRQWLSAVKGGGLARLCQAPMRALILSDVIGDPVAAIASGPTAHPIWSAKKAWEELLSFYGSDPMRVPDRVRRHFESLIAEGDADTVPPVPANVRNHIVGSNSESRLAAEACARELGYPRLVSHYQDHRGVDHRYSVSDLRGDSANAGRTLAQVALDYWERGESAVLIAGGETTTENMTNTRCQHSGGRCATVGAAALMELLRTAPSGSNPLDHIAVVVFATDAEDGKSKLDYGPPPGARPPAAGVAVCDIHRGVDPGQLALAMIHADEGPFFAGMGGAIDAGTSRTNVYDILIVVVSPPVS